MYKKVETKNNNFQAADYISNMTFNISIQDLTQRNLGRILLAKQRLNNNTVATPDRTYNNVKVEKGGFRVPGFSRQATVVILIDKSKLLDHEGLHKTIRDLTPFLSASNKIFIIEHLDDGSSPNMMLAKEGKLWHKEVYRHWHLARMEYNCRFYDVNQLMSIIMDVMVTSWPLGGDASMLGRNLQLDYNGRHGRPMNC